MWSQSHYLKGLNYTLEGVPLEKVPQSISDCHPKYVVCTGLAVFNSLFSVLDIEPRGLCMLGKTSTTELIPSLEVLPSLFIFTYLFYIPASIS